MEIKKVGVIGAGQMGHGIAQVLAAAGVEVVLRDISEEFVQKGYTQIGKNLERLVGKGRLSAADRDATLARIQTTTSISALADVDLAIEAATENPAIKKKIFAELDATVKPGALLATNTSSISVTMIAAVTKRPDRVIGMHFMNPVPVMKLVEIIRALQTSDATYDAIHALTEKVGKVPVLAGDSPGFISNRVLLPMINEAIYCVYEGVGTAAAVDEVLKLGMNHPMGPLALADLIGLDTCLYIMEVLSDGFRDSKYRPCPLLVKMVEAGYLGRKTGQGFYSYGG
ncbi:MAG TPA: 3-hydroxybutyryl-CoA dehydrogenase [Deferrisomatales bacterium]|nr:3-hydroxybutyryl-CoA dehydrogenase [Deferrisomatales bacterium]